MLKIFPLFTPLYFQSAPDGSRVHLQCLAGLHNPLFETAAYRPPAVPHSKQFLLKEAKISYEDEHQECSDEEGSDCSLASNDEIVRKCDAHEHSHHTTLFTNFDGVTRCILVDTGAQVSCVAESVFRRSRMPLIHVDNLRIEGIGCNTNPVIGAAEFTFKFGNVEMSHDFIIVDDTHMKFCFMIGIDFITLHGIIIDMMNNRMIVKERSIPFPPIEDHLPVLTIDENYNSMNTFEYVGVCNVFSPSKISLCIDSDECLLLQKNSRLAQLKRKVVSGNEDSWPITIRKYHRYRKKLVIHDELLFFVNDELMIPVVPFQFLVEVALTIHYQQGHPGRQKLLSSVLQNVWHPSVNSVVADICRTCDRCQRVKIAAQAHPPIIKITTAIPFELVAVDLMTLPKTSSGNVCCLVVVDHNSKWLSVVPLRRKTASVVTVAMRNHVLPSLAKIPDKILSDNGPEFKSVEFNELLHEWGIKHVYTSAYKPSSNGLAERTNRTVAELLRNVGAAINKWDDRISDVVMTYNHSYHSGLKESPASYLLTKSHSLLVTLPLSHNVRDTWKEGNPSFKSFKPGQLVLRRVVRKGRNVNDKLKDCYDGPYEVTVQHRNKVTYVIADSLSGTSYNVHHTQLRRYYKPPSYLSNHYFFLDSDLEGSNSIESEDEEELSDADYRTSALGTRRVSSRDSSSSPASLSQSFAVPGMFSGDSSSLEESQLSVSGDS